MLPTDGEMLSRLLSCLWESPALNFNLSDPGVEPLGLSIEGIDLLRHGGSDDGELLDDLFDVDGEHLVHLS